MRRFPGANTPATMMGLDLLERDVTKASWARASRLGMTPPSARALPLVRGDNS